MVRWAHIYLLLSLDLSETTLDGLTFYIPVTLFGPQRNNSGWVNFLYTCYSLWTSAKHSLVVQNMEFLPTHFMIRFFPR
jgi:hypothetical protein